MDFYTHPASPNCRKVDAVADQLGIALETKHVDLFAGRIGTGIFCDQPNGKVRALVDGDVKLWESTAIVCYIASKTDNDLWPKSNLRYDIMRCPVVATGAFRPRTLSAHPSVAIYPRRTGEPARELAAPNVVSEPSECALRPRAVK